MLSPNLLNSQIPYVGGRGVENADFPTFDTESKSAKIPNSLCGQGGGGGVGRAQTFKILLSPNLLKSQIPYAAGGGGVERGPSNFC